MQHTALPSHLFHLLTHFCQVNDIGSLPYFCTWKDVSKVMSRLLRLLQLSYTCDGCLPGLAIQQLMLLGLQLPGAFPTAHML